MGLPLVKDTLTVVHPVHSSNDHPLVGAVVKATMLHTVDHNLTGTGADSGSNHHYLWLERLAVSTAKNSGG